MEIVTNSRWANLAHTIPAALSIKESKRPPNNVLYELVSCGKTSSISVTGSVLNGSMLKGDGLPSFNPCAISPLNVRFDEV